MPVRTTLTIADLTDLLAEAMRRAKSEERDEMNERVRRQALEQERDHFAAEASSASTRVSVLDADRKALRRQRLRMVYAIATLAITLIGLVIDRLRTNDVANDAAVRAVDEAERARREALDAQILELQQERDTTAPR